MNLLVPHIQLTDIVCVISCYILLLLLLYLLVIHLSWFIFANVGICISHGVFAKADKSDLGFVCKMKWFFNSSMLSYFVAWTISNEPQGKVTMKRYTVS